MATFERRRQWWTYRPRNPDFAGESEKPDFTRKSGGFPPVMLLIDMKPQNYLPLPAPINVAGDGLVPTITFSTSPTSTGQPCGWVKLGMPWNAQRCSKELDLKDWEAKKKEMDGES